MVLYIILGGAQCCIGSANKMGLAEEVPCINLSSELCFILLCGKSGAKAKAGLPPTDLFGRTGSAC